MPVKYKFIKDMVLRDEEASHTKVWMNIACLVATMVILWYAWHIKLTDWMFILYLATVGGFDVVFRLISARYGGSDSTITKTEDSTSQMPTPEPEVVKCKDCPNVAPQQ